MSLSALEEVVGEILDSFRLSSFEEVGYGSVQASSLFEENSLVGGFLHQSVAEAEEPFGDSGDLSHELAALKLGETVVEAGEVGKAGGEFVVAELPADDAGGLGDVTGALIE